MDPKTNPPSADTMAAHAAAASDNVVSNTSPNAQEIEHITAAMANYEAEALSKCQAELATAQAKGAEMADQYLRAKADAENARRRAEDDVSKARKFAIESFADSLLPVLDSLEAGLNAKEVSLDTLREGSQATLRQLLAALERNKVLPIDPPAGSKFDPNLHQAISVVPSEQDANTVVTVLQKGYMIADRLLRNALVTVAAPK